MIKMWPIQYPGTYQDIKSFLIPYKAEISLREIIINNIEAD